MTQGEIAHSSVSKAGGAPITTLGTAFILGSLQRATMGMEAGVRAGMGAGTLPLTWLALKALLVVPGSPHPMAGPWGLGLLCSIHTSLGDA